MFEKIYVHIGLPKTGSTAIQNCMEALSRAGELKVVSYPVFGTDRGWQSIESGNGAAIAELLAPDITPEFCAVRLQETFSELLDACEPSSRVLLISSEHFFSAATERFLLFKDLLLKHAAHVELIMCVRKLSDISYSSYHQSVKRHGCSLVYGADWFSFFVDDVFSKLERIDAWGMVGSVLPYKKQGLLNDFLGLIGEDAALGDQFESRRVNRSLTAGELDLLIKINSVFESEPLSMRISDHWIYARPEVASVEIEHDTVALYELFNLKASTLEGSFSSEEVRKVIDIIGFGGGDDLGAGGGEGELSAEKKEDQFDELLLMALVEIKAFMGLEAELGVYTNQLKKTKEAFDPVHYLLLNRDVLVAGIDPVLHYKKFGVAEGRNSAYNLTSILVGL